jgi:hypothetical protein
MFIYTYVYIYIYIYIYIYVYIYIYIYIQAPDWKGELQTFLARNCKDFPFKIEYNSEERVAGGKFVARVTITFDNKEEENRVVYGIPAVNKKSTERTAAGNYHYMYIYIHIYVCIYV